MIDARTASLLQNKLRRLSRSFLQYVGDMYPWTPPEEADAWVQVQKLVREEGAAAAELARFLQRRRVTVSFPGSFPSEFTGLGFVALDYLLPRLAQYERQAVAACERDLAALSDAEAKALVQKILDQKRNHLKALEALTAAHPETVKH